MPVPKSLSTELYQRFSQLHWWGQMIDSDSDEYRTLEREARKLIQTQPADGYDALGTLCVLSGDQNGMRSNYENAIRLSGNLDHRSNYAISLINLGFFSEATKFMGYMEKPEKGFLELGIILNVECARFRRASHLVNQWNTLHPEDIRDPGSLPRAAKMVEKANIAEDAFLPSLDNIGKVLRDHRLFFNGEPLVDVVSEGSLEEIAFRFLVVAPPQVVVDLETKMIDRLFESGFDRHDSTIRFGFLSAEEIAKQAA